MWKNGFGFEFGDFDRVKPTVMLKKKKRKQIMTIKVNMCVNVCVNVWVCVCACVTYGQGKS